MTTINMRNEIAEELILSGKVEAFEKIEGFDNYLVSNFGRIYNVKKESFLNGYLNEFGYRKTKLKNNEGQIKSLSIHRLVMLAFVPNPDNKPQVNHKDGVKINNNISNLEWNTARENIVHSFETGLHERNYISEKDLIGMVSKTTKGLDFVVDRKYEVKDNTHYYVVRFIGSNNEKVVSKQQIINKNFGDFVYFINNIYVTSEELKKSLDKYDVKYKTVHASLQRKGCYRNDLVSIYKATNYKVDKEAK